MEGAVAAAAATVAKRLLLQMLLKCLGPQCLVLRSLVPQGQRQRRCELVVHRAHGLHHRAVLMC